MRNSKYRFKEYTFSQLKDSVALPQFQRSLVWKKEQKEKFIDSALSGNPFGVLLLHDDIVSKKLIIIDGLQRYSTLKSFYDDPFKYRTIKSNEHEDLIKVVQRINSVYDSSSEEFLFEQLDDLIAKTIKNIKFELERDTLFEDKLLNSITDIYPGLKNTQEAHLIYKNISRFWTHYKDEISIAYLNIPAIIFDGETSELPEIFQMLNTGGTKLTKYEVFSSSWSHVLLSNVSSKIAKEVEKKYKKLMEDTDLIIENYVEGEIENSKKVSLYEYAYGVGKIITKNSDKLMGSKTVKYDTTESIGFSALITFLGIHLKDLETLKVYINDKTKSNNLTKFTSIIESCFTDVENILVPYISDFTKYIESQVLSIVYTWFKIHYNVNIHTLEVTEKEHFIQNEELFKKNMPYRFLMDILRNFWAGSGDSKLYEVVTSDLEVNRYLTPINKDSLEVQLLDWNESQLQKPSKTISADTKLVMSFVLKPFFESDFQEPLIPQFVVPKDLVPKTNNILPAGHLGNTYFLEKGLRDFKSVYLFDKKINIQDYYFYPEKHEIAENILDIQYEEYMSFIHERSKKLIKHLLDNI